MANNKTNQATAAAFTDIEWDVIDGGNTDFEVKYPRMQWQHGEAKASGWLKSGGLFINSEEYPNFTGEGFEASTLVTDEGKEVEGFAAVSAKLAVIRVKHQWVKDEKYHRNVPLVHALCFVKGCEDPINLSLRGANKALKFQSAFNQHIAQNVAVANRTKPANAPSLEPFALWFPIAAAPSEKAPSKEGDKSSSVTPPSIQTPETIDRNYVASLWVGKDNYQQFAAFWKETQKWQSTKIWEQRTDDDAVHESDAPEFSGDDDAPVNDNLLRQLINLATAKGFEERETMLNITHGERELYDQLTNGEARAAINTLKAK